MVALPAHKPVVERAWEGSLNGVSDRVVIGMDAHKSSATIEVMTGEEPSGRE
jgi:hypothetical protein